MKMNKIAAALTVMGVAFSAYADEKVEKIEITGSSIKRVSKEGSLPVTTITKEDLARTGAVTAQDLLSMIPSSFGGTVVAGNVGATGVASTAQLRGLPSKYTLVLLNGRRVANFALGNAVIDLNSIPMSVIERVEVLRDGASALYGADAVAGVINFITKKNFKGVEVAAYKSQSQHGGGDVKNFNVTMGAGDLDQDRMNLFLSLYHEEDKPLKATEREFAKTAVRPDLGVNKASLRNGVPNLNFTDTKGNSYSGVNPYRYNGCQAPAFALAGVDDPTQCGTDYVKFIDLIPRAQHDNAVGRLTLKLDENTQLFAEGMYVRDKVQSFYSPAPYTTKNAILPASSRWYPGKATSTFPNGIVLPKGMTLPKGYVMPNGDVLAADTPLANDMTVMPDATKPLGGRWRTVAGGGRSDISEQITNRFSVGLKGTLLNWDYETALTSAMNRNEISFGPGKFSYKLIDPLLASGEINLLGTQDAAAQAALNSALLTGLENRGVSKSQEWDFKLSRELMPMADGSLGVAFGGNIRNEELSQYSAPVLATGDEVGGSGPIPGVEGKRKVYAMFGEVLIPMAKGLEGSVSLRYDNYKNDFLGNAQNSSFNRVSPKAQIRYQPTKGLVLRGSVAQGFRAPTLYENLRPFTEGNNTSGNWSDTLRCAPDATKDLASPYKLKEQQDECNIQQTTALSGNPTLKPEKSDQFSFGIVFAPIDSMTVGVDYWNVKISDAIQPQSEIQVMGNQAAFKNSIVRYDPAVYKGSYDLAGGVPGLNGKVAGLHPGSTDVRFPIAYIYLPYMNTAKVFASGLDLNAQYRFRIDGVGKMTANYDSTVQLKHGYQYDGASEVSDLGKYGDFGTIPRYRHTLSLSGDFGSFGASVTHNFTQGYDDYTNKGAIGANYPATRKVDAVSTFDLRTSYRGMKNLDLAFGVKNLFDKEPPSSRNELFFQVGYDAQYADPLGRVFYANAKYKF